MRIFKWFVVAALCPLIAFAFEPEEHQEVSNDALRAAANHYAGSHAMRAAAEKIGSKFGDVTRGVDWFSDAGDNLLDPAKYEEELRARGAPKPLPFLKRSIAMHNNSTHFQNEALQQWRKYHQHAIALATDPQKAEHALLAEAAALHYLQDFFSSGHLVTPRAGMHNAAAGQLHDYFVQRGVDLALAESAVVNGAIEKLVLAEALTREEANLYRAAAGKNRWHGDRWLHRRPAQNAFVAAISTLSLAEVFEASAGERKKGLQPCFNQRFRLAQPPQPVITHAGPEGGIRVVDVSAAEVPPVVACVGEEWIARYLTREDPELTRSYFSLSGVDVRAEAGLARDSRDVRLSFDVLFLLLADDPQGDEKQSRWLKLKMGSAGPTFISSDRYEAWGLLYDYTLPTRYRALSWGWRFAPRRYDYKDAQPWRVDAGVKAGVGVDIINIVVTADWAHGVAPDGRFRPDLFVGVAGDIAIAEGWTDRAWGFIGRRFGGS